MSANIAKPTPCPTSSGRLTDKPHSAQDMWERVSLVGGQQVESGHQYNLSDQKRRPTTSFEEFPLEAEDLTQLIDTRERPELPAERLELRGWIERGLGTLPVEQREVLILYDSEGYSYQEIVEITGFPMGSVKSRLCRGRSRLRDFLVCHRVLPL